MAPAVVQLSSGRAWYVVILCMVAYIFSFIDRQILTLLIEPIQADLGISDTQFGLLHGFAFALFYASMGVPIASFSDRMSRPMIISIGVAFWSVATVACGFARSFGQLFLARICVGAGEAALSPATYSLISDLFPREKLGRAVAIYSLGSFLGAGIALLVGGAVIAAVSGNGEHQFLGLSFAPWQLTFMIVGAPGILLGLLIMATVRDPRSGQTGATEQPSFGAVLRYLLQEKAIFVPHMAGYTFAAAALFALLSWSPAYLMRTFGMTAGDVGIQLGLVAVFAAGGGVLSSGWIMDWLTRRGYGDAPFRTGIIGAAGAVLPLFTLPFAGGSGMAVAILAAAFFFASFPMPPSTAVMQIAAPPTMRSRVSALFLVFNAIIGMGGGSFAIGLLNDRLFEDPKAVGASIALVGGVSAVLTTIVLAFGLRPFRTYLVRAGG